MGYVHWPQNYGICSLATELLIQLNAFDVGVFAPFFLLYIVLTNRQVAMNVRICQKKIRFPSKKERNVFYRYNLK